MIGIMGGGDLKTIGMCRSRWSDKNENKITFSLKELFIKPMVVKIGNLKCY